MGSTLIAIGSDYSEEAKVIEYYNFDLDKWFDLVVVDVKNRSKFQSVLLNGKIMIVGGFEELDYSSTLQSYDIITDTMTTLAPTKYSKYGCGIAILDGLLYAIGGFDDEYQNYAERYNPSTDQWTELPPMPTARYSVGVAANESEVFVIGGFGEDYYEIVESYNPKTNVWKKCASMNEKRNFPGVAAIGNFIYAVGGNLNLTYSKTAEKYDPVADKWTYIENISVRRGACTAINYIDSLLVAGGFAEDYVKTGLVESYKNDVWTIKGSLATPRAYFSLIEIPWTFIKQVQSKKK